MYTISIYDYEGTIDCFGNINNEDRYIVLDCNGFDYYGSNFTLNEAQELCNELNN